MNVLSLFDGMSCGQQALDRLGVKVDNYFASEIDKYAIKITQKNYPDTIQLGDVRDVKGSDLPNIDLILGGSPCQGFSFAGKQLAFDDPRSALFFEFIRLLKECKPKYFLMENVRMKKEYINIITDQVSECYPDYQGTGSDLFNNRIEPILINSALLSAQNRQRYYWTNIPNITQPKDRGIVLRDVLETNPGNDLDKMTTKDGKSYCLTARYQGAVYWNSLARKQRTMIPLTKPKQVGTAVDIRGHDYNKRVYSPDGKSPTLNAHGGGNLEPKVVAGAWRGRSLDESGKNVGWKETKPKQMLELRKDEKSNSLTSFRKDNLVVEKTHTLKANYFKSSRANFENDTSKGGKFSATGVQQEDLTWRKLTPLECERLQTVKDNYTDGVSNTQRYKMLGNGWTVEVICHILNNIN